MGEEIMLDLLSRKAAVIEDLDKNIIYILGRGGAMRRIENYQTTYTNIDSVQISEVLPLMKLVMEELKQSKPQNFNQEDVSHLEEGLRMVDMLSRMQK